MNESNIDRLFQGKLSSFEMKPSENAWNKVNESISIKNRKQSPWIYSIAATLVLLIVSTFLWNNFTSNQDSLTGEVTENLTKDPVTDLNEKLEATEESILLSNPSETIIPATKKVTNKILETTEPEVQYNPEVHIENADLGRISHLPSIRKKTLVFPTYISAQLQLDFEFIETTNVDPVLLENDNGFKKAFDFARRLKNGEEGLIDLRDVKNNFIAKASEEFQKIKINRKNDESDD